MLLATVGKDQYYKVYDVINFGACSAAASNRVSWPDPLTVRPHRGYQGMRRADMINMVKLPYKPRCCQWIFKRGAPQATLAVYGRAHAHLVSAGRRGPWLSAPDGLRCLPCCLVHRTNEETSDIYIYDGRSPDSNPLSVVQLHSAPVVALKVGRPPRTPGDARDGPNACERLSGATARWTVQRAVPHRDLGGQPRPGGVLGPDHL